MTRTSYLAYRASVLLAWLFARLDDALSKRT